MLAAGVLTVLDLCIWTCDIQPRQAGFSPQDLGLTQEHSPGGNTLQLPGIGESPYRKVTFPPSFSEAVSLSSPGWP